MKHFLLLGDVVTHTSSSKCDEWQASTECWNIFSCQNEISTGLDEFWSWGVPTCHCIPFVYFFFCLPCWRRYIRKKMLLHEIADILPPMSFRIFMVSSLTCKFLIHLEFILVCGRRRCPSFIFLHITVQFSQHHLLNKLSLAHCLCLLPLSNINWL